MCPRRFKKSRGTHVQQSLAMKAPARPRSQQPGVHPLVVTHESGDCPRTAVDRRGVHAPFSAAGGLWPVLEHGSGEPPDEGYLRFSASGTRAKAGVEYRLQRKRGVNAPWGHSGSLYYPQIMYNDKGNALVQQSPFCSATLKGRNNLLVDKTLLRPCRLQTVFEPQPLGRCPGLMNSNPSGSAALPIIQTPRCGVVASPRRTA